jgi:hypothetical protein
MARPDRLGCCQKSACWKSGFAQQTRWTASSGGRQSRPETRVLVRAAAKRQRGPRFRSPKGLDGRGGCPSAKKKVSRRLPLSSCATDRYPKDRDTKWLGPAPLAQDRARSFPEDALTSHRDHAFGNGVLQFPRSSTFPNRLAPLTFGLSADAILHVKTFGFCPQAEVYDLLPLNR